MLYFLVTKHSLGSDLYEEEASYVNCERWSNNVPLRNLLAYVVSCAQSERATSRSRGRGQPDPDP